MAGLLKKNSITLLSTTSNPLKKLPYTWKIIKVKKKFIDINTHYTNKIVYEALLLRSIKNLTYDHLKKEVKYGTNSKIDSLLEKKNLNRSEKCYLFKKRGNSRTP